MSFLGFANNYREFMKGYADKVYPMQKLMRNKGKKFEWNEGAQAAFENIKRELCEAPVLGTPTERGTNVLDIYASVVAMSGILHQEQEWNGRTVLRPIAYGSKVLSDMEIKEGFSFLNKKTYEALLSMSWLDKSGHPIPGQLRVTGGKGSGNEDLIKEGPGDFGSVATFEPGPKGTLSYEHKQPLVAG